jgi:hypothetical protein
MLDTARMFSVDFPQLALRSTCGCPVKESVTGCGGGCQLAG